MKREWWKTTFSTVLRQKMGREKSFLFLARHSFVKGKILYFWRYCRCCHKEVTKLWVEIKKRLEQLSGWQLAIIDKSSQKKSLEELLNPILQGFNKSSARGKNGPTGSIFYAADTHFGGWGWNRGKLPLILKYSVMATANDRKQL